jgi:hypothetical protein
VATLRLVTTLNLTAKPHGEGIRYKAGIHKGTGKISTRGFAVSSMQVPDSPITVYKKIKTTPSKFIVI